MSLIIKDDFLPPEILERQLQIVENTEWTLAPTTYNPRRLESTSIKQNWGFARIIEFNETWESEWYWTINLIICARFPQLKGLSLERVRLGLLTKGEKQTVNIPHVDGGYPLYTGLLYLNDVDGDTHFYKERFQSEEQALHLLNSQNFTLDQRVSPRTNRFVLFDGDTYHASCTPTTNYYRWVVNFNWRKE